MTRTLLVGFDSAWTDQARQPGAVAMLGFEDGRPAAFDPPVLARFDAARDLIAARAADADLLLVAIDQPTVVANRAGARPVDRIAASLVVRMKGGVQPACRDGYGARMFGDGAPIWRFLDALHLEQDPQRARTASHGRFAIEVFPALALPALVPALFERRRGAKYNPAVRKHFLLTDWHLVCTGLAASANGLGLAALADWADTQATIARPTKSDQDRLDAALCLAIACHWRQAPASQSLLLGDVETGYIVTPASPETATILLASAARPKKAIRPREQDKPLKSSVRREETMPASTADGRVDPDQLRTLLIGKARRNELITYGEVAAHFGQQFHQGYMSSLKSALGQVSKRNQQNNEPQLMCLVVSKKTGIPGEGFFIMVDNHASTPGERHRLFDLMRRRCHEHPWP